MVALILIIGILEAKLRHEKYFSSAAGDTSEASAGANHLGSIHEAEGDAMRASSEKADHWW